ncbi:MAG TPA: ligase-associated DNA damage response endonuclease PdeM [Stellaceae bacterium]|nr:ligase-associated DNA damage response endonuclease PdeM [Stellaceae bacterium]
MNSLTTRDTWCSAATVLALGRASFVADPMGALYWPEERLLAVADLHLEKGSAFAARRVFLPPYDTATTLAALAVLVARYAPRGVLALGDSFHDVSGGERLAAQDRATLSRLQSGRDWIWVAGNHDPVLPADLGGARHAEIAIGGIMFRHRPEAEGEAEIAGHFHPMARVAGTVGSVRRRCFVSNGARCVLPAFGAYAGGLNLRDRAFAALFGPGGAAVFAHVLGRERVYRVAQEQCLPD